jgi:hypothetical protein
MPRHVAEGPVDAPGDAEGPWTRIGLWSARVGLVLAVVVIVLAVVTRPSWSSQGFDADGYPLAVLPDVALVCALVLGVGWPWFSGIAASTRSVHRDGDELVAVTVYGRRRVRSAGATSVRFRMLTNVGTVHGALLVDRRLRPLVVLDPIGAGGASRLQALLGHGSERIARVVLEHLFGLAWLLVTAVVVVALVTALLVLFSAP